MKPSTLLLLCFGFLPLAWANPFSSKLPAPPPESPSPRDVTEPPARAERPQAAPEAPAAPAPASEKLSPAQQPPSPWEWQGSVRVGMQRWIRLRYEDAWHWVQIGQQVAGWTVVAWLDDRLMLQKGDQKLELTLSQPSQTATSNSALAQ